MPEAYSPLSFFFNFSHNVMKGQIVDSLLWSLSWPVGLNDLLTSEPRLEEDPERSRVQLARTLTAYARTNPHKIRGRLMPVIVYDWARKPQEEFRALTSAAILVLLFITIVANAGAVLLRNRYERRW